MTIKELKNKAQKFFKRGASSSEEVGVDRKMAKPRLSKKDFDEIAEITFRKHEKSFEKLAE